MFNDAVANSIKDVLILTTETIANLCLRDVGVFLGNVVNAVFAIIPPGVEVEEGEEDVVEMMVTEGAR